MIKYCAKCEKDVEVHISQEDEIYPVKGTNIQIKANVCRCIRCGEMIWDSEFDGNNLLRAYNKYREINQLLLPEEIKRIREEYGISQVNFARILGVGDKTIARYENGSLQDEAINNLILMAKERNNFLILFDKNKDRLPMEEQQRLDYLLKPNNILYLLRPTVQDYSFVINAGNERGITYSNCEGASLDKFELIEA